MNGNYKTYPIMKNGHVYHVNISRLEYKAIIGDAYTSIDHALLNTGDILDITFTVPSGFRGEFTYAIQTALATSAEYFWGSTVTGGVTKNSRNRNEESTKTEGPLITIGGTIESAGVLKASWAWGTADKSPFSPNLGGSSANYAMIWPQNAIRRFRLTSQADANNVSFRSNCNVCAMIPEEL